MTASPILPSTQLAQLQEKIMERSDYVAYTAKRYAAELLQYQPLLDSTPNSNLHARQDGILSALYHRAENAKALGYFYSMNERCKRLARDGYWSEGPDYWLYVKAAYDWYELMTGNKISGPVHDMRMNNYLNLVAPDGTIPVPEASDGTYPVPTACVSNDKYIVQRWPSGAYLLVDVGAECDPDNLHDWLSAGYFALYVPPRHYEHVADAIPGYCWKHRCPSYTGFSWANALDPRAHARLFPTGAILPTWRLKPPRVTVVKGDSSVTVTWRYPWSMKVKRVITWSASEVKVCDSWGLFGKRVRTWRVG